MLCGSQAHACNFLLGLNATRLAGHAAIRFDAPAFQERFSTPCLPQAQRTTVMASRVPAPTACAAVCAALLCLLHGAAVAFTPGDIVAIEGGYRPEVTATTDTSTYLVVRLSTSSLCGCRPSCRRIDPH